MIFKLSSSHSSYVISFRKALPRHLLSKISLNNAKIAIEHSVLHSYRSPFFIIKYQIINVSLRKNEFFNVKYHHTATVPALWVSSLLGWYWLRKKMNDMYKKGVEKFQPAGSESNLTFTMRCLFHITTLFIAISERYKWAKLNSWLVIFWN